MGISPSYSHTHGIACPDSINCNVLPTILSKLYGGHQKQYDNKYADTQLNTQLLISFSCLQFVQRLFTEIAPTNSQLPSVTTITSTIYSTIFSHLSCGPFSLYLKLLWYQYCSSHILQLIDIHFLHLFSQPATHFQSRASSFLCSCFVHFKF